MKFYVPTIGDKIYLVEDWTFTLYKEHRNEGLAKRLDKVKEVKHEQKQWVRKFRNKVRFYGGYDTIYLPKYEENDFHLESCNEHDMYAYESTPYRWTSKTWKDDEFQVTLPRGTELKVSRIYIRSTYREFDSITWVINNCPLDKKLNKARFWVKLKDANRIVCDLFPIADLDAPVAQESRFSNLEIE